MLKSYAELRHLQTFEERFEYLKLGGTVGRATFGFERYLNQSLYKSKEWMRVRHQVIVRDNACDLGVGEREINGRVLVHHINPITAEDIEEARECVFDVFNLICTTHATHNAIHYGDASLLVKLPQERIKGDTALWTASSHLLRDF